LRKISSPETEEKTVCGWRKLKVARGVCGFWSANTHWIELLLRSKHFACKCEFCNVM
jgi:hypothetical protein